MSELKIRASQVGKIMTETRTKSNRQKYDELSELRLKKSERLAGLSEKALKSREKLVQEIDNINVQLKELKPLRDVVELSDTAKSLLSDIFWEREFNIRHEIVNRYLEKGNEQELESIRLANNVHNWLECEPEYLKNELHFENNFVTGTPDIILENAVIDIKTSWSSQTFPLTKTELPSTDYYYQVMTYLALTDREVGFVTYCLVDTPENLIQDELWRFARNHGLLEVPEDEEMRIRESHLYSRLPEKVRVKTFKIERDEEVIQRIYDRVEECRQYYNTELLTQIF